MAMMAAQAPLMMMNPMSMFGFNPMNYSSALENAGYPAKRFQQMDVSGNNNLNSINTLNAMQLANQNQENREGKNFISKNFNNAKQ